MGGPYRRKNTHKSIKKFKKQFLTSRRAKDIDQIYEDLQKRKNQMMIDDNIDDNMKNNGYKVIPVNGNSDSEDLPGGGKFPCFECHKNFIDAHALEMHKKSKLHKKRLKLLKETPFSIKESEAAGGAGTNDFYSK